MRVDALAAERAQDGDLDDRDSTIIGGIAEVIGRGELGGERDRRDGKGQESARRLIRLDHDAIAIRPMVYLTLTFDHRVLDGAVADRFMAAVKDKLESWR